MHNVYFYLQKFIFERSGLNQWNANGRKRDFEEIFTVKVCQENSKALMINPNKALSDWLLRRVLQLAEGELATIEKLDKLGFDSVIIMKDENGDFIIDIMKTNTYAGFNTEPKNKHCLQQLEFRCVRSPEKHNSFV